MAKATKESLEAKIKQLQGINDSLIQENTELRGQIEELREGIDKQAQQELKMAYVEIDKLKKHIAWQSGRIEQLENKNISKKHNARGAGRKPKVDANAEEKVLQLKQEGLSLRAIAGRVNVSHTAVSKIIKKFTKNNISFNEEEVADIEGKKHKQLKI